MITAEIIAVGSELLRGGRVETNSIFLSEWLAGRGIDVRFKSVVGDEIHDLGAAVSTAVARARVVLITGGLGPTVDDRTREAVAAVTGKPLRLCVPALAMLKARLRVTSRPLSEHQRRQAFLPAGADLLRNPAGTAPGFSLTWKRCRIVCLPGVSHETRRMMASAVLPILRRDGLLGSSLQSRMIHTFGLVEGEVDARLRGIIPVGGPFRLGLLASPLGVSVSLTSTGSENIHTGEGRAGRAEASRAGKSRVVLKRVMDDVIAALGHYVVSDNGQPVEAVVGQRLRERGFTIAVAESCTGGLIGHRLTSVPGSSACMDRGVVCYSNGAKMDLLGVAGSVLRRHGAVSAQVARAMAEGIRTRSRVDIGLSVTGLAGPAGATLRKPVGLVYIGLATPTQSLTKQFRFHGDRQTITLRSSQGALDVLRRWLYDLPIDDG